MAKIRLKNLPDGFEIKNGKVVKKMQQGGMMTGDQSNYSLVTTPYNLMGNQFNNDKDSDIRYSLSSVPRDMANIEAEGGETVLTDLNNDGQFGLYNITGPRHGSGGVPMFLPEQSFVFSDTQKMKMNRQELAEFGIESRKKMTPAQISKKYQLNEFIGAMRDEDADPIKIKSAELMIDKNQKSLSKLAFGQEAKKNFADGVPLAAHPYLVMQGIDPIEFTQKVENITREQAAQRIFEGLSPEQQAKMMALRQMMEQAGQMQQPQAAYGMELPKAQNGIPNYRRMSNGKYGIPKVAEAKEGGYYLNPQTGQGYLFTNGKYQEYQKEVMTSDGEIQTRQNTTNSQANGGNPPANTNNKKRSTGTPGGRVLDVSGVEGGRSLGSNYKQYEELERLFTSGEDTWNQTIDRAYAAFVANAKAQGIEPNQIPAKDVMISKFLDYQKNNYMIADLLPDEYRYATELDRGAGDRKNKNTQALFNKAKELYPDIYGGYNIDENDTKLNQLFFQAVTVADKDNAEPYLSYTATGPNQNTNWADNKTISKAEGFYGNNTLNQFLQVKEPITPPPPEPPKEGCPCEDGSYSMECCPKPGDTPDPVKGPDAEFWIQDLIKMGALGMRDRDMFLPWQPAVEIPKSGYVLEEPTRQLADVNEQFNIASQAIGAFAGPQSLNARIGQAAGNALKANANTFAQVHSRNIGTVNRGKMMDAQFEAAAKREQRDRSVKEYDDTQLTLQNYMDEKNLDREQMADLMANAYTNMANTYNLNTLYPYFNIDPVSGGMIDITADLPALVANKNAGSQLSPYDEMSSRALDLKAKGLDGTIINTILQNTYGTKAVANANTGTDPYADVMRDIRAAGMPAGYPTAKKGKEIKKYAVPFYMGKIGY
jgi:hypothetical protein